MELHGGLQLIYVQHLPNSIRYPFTSKFIHQKPSSSIGFAKVQVMDIIDARIRLR